MVGSKLTKIHMVNSTVVTATLYSTRIPEDRLSTRGKLPSVIKSRFIEVRYCSQVKFHEILCNIG